MLHTNNRIFGLDLFRAIAILFVLIAHTITIIKTNNITQTIVYYTAILGVEFFFVLSGYLIGSIIIKTHNKQKITTFQSIKIFWIRRWFRTLPNYYLVLLITLSLYILGKSYTIFKTTKLLLYFVFLQNSVFQTDNTFFGTSWSLCIEEWFYLLFPLILYVLQFFFLTKRASLLFTIILILLSSLLLRVLFYINTDIMWDAGFRKMIVLRLDSIGYGVLAAFFSYYIPNWNQNRRLLIKISIIFMIILLAIFQYKFVMHHNEDFFMKTFFFSFLGISIALSFPFLISIKSKTNNYAIRFINIISTISYSLYLIHPIIGSIVFHFCTHINNYCQFIIIWIVSFLVAYVQYNFFEKRMTVLREQYGDNKLKVSV